MIKNKNNFKNKDSVSDLQSKITIFDKTLMNIQRKIKHCSTTENQN
jgi:hypothetical protein